MNTFARPEILSVLLLNLLALDVRSSLEAEDSRRDFL